jgi:hypothetical protein
VAKVLRVAMFQVDRGILICEGAGGLIRRWRECGVGGGELRCGGYKANRKFLAQRSHPTIPIPNDSRKANLPSFPSSRRPPSSSARLFLLPRPRHHRDRRPPISSELSTPPNPLYRRHPRLPPRSPRARGRQQWQRSTTLLRMARPRKTPAPA